MNPVLTDGRPIGVTMNRPSFSERYGRTAFAFAIAFMIALLLFALAGCSSDAQASDGKELYETKCSSCHSLDTVDNASYQTADQWRDVVDRMKDMSSTISDDDAEKITEYLANR